jgi:hypothetical protein
MPGNLNAAIAAAKGDFIANLHDADEFDPRLLEFWERALLQHPSAGIVFCGLDAKRYSEGAGRVWIHELAPVTPGRAFFEARYVGASGSPIWGTVMARRSVYRRHFPFDCRFGPWADVDMWMRICATHDIAYVPLPLISLDQSSSSFRTFRWDTVLLIHAMYFLNIRRMADSDDQCRRWLRRQRLHFTYQIWRLATGGLLKGDFGRFASMLWRCPDWLRLMTGSIGTETTVPAHPLCRPECEHVGGTSRNRD